MPLSKSPFCLSSLFAFFLLFSNLSFSGAAEISASAASQSSPPALSLDDISGVYCITADRMFNDPIWDLKITGVSVRTYWNKVEPEKGKYDWTFLDNVVARGREKNKKVKLFVLFGSGVPQWVNCKFITGSADSLYDSAGARVAVPWDENLRREQKEFIRAFARRYRNEPHVSFLHMAGPSARWAELALPNNLQKEPGYSNEAIFESWKQVIDTWAEERGNKRVSCSVSAAPKYYPSLARDIVAYAAGDPLKADDHGRIGQDFLPQWCFLDSKFQRGIRESAAQYFPKCIIGEQMWGATVWPDRRCEDYDATLKLAHDVHSTLVEIYDADLNIPELARKAEALDAQIHADLKNPDLVQPLSGPAQSPEAAAKKFDHIKPWTDTTTAPASKSSK